MLYNYINHNLVLVPRNGPVKRPQLRNTILLGRINMPTSTDSSSGPPLSFFYFSMSSTGSTSTFMIYWKSDFQTIMTQPQCNNKFWSMMIVMSRKSQLEVLISIKYKHKAHIQKWQDMTSTKLKTEHFLIWTRTEMNTYKLLAMLSILHVYIRKFMSIP